MTDRNSNTNGWPGLARAGAIVARMAAIVKQLVQILLDTEATSSRGRSAVSSSQGGTAVSKRNRIGSANLARCPRGPWAAAWWQRPQTTAGQVRRSPKGTPDRVPIAARPAGFHPAETLETRRRVRVPARQLRPDLAWEQAVVLVRWPACGADLAPPRNQLLDRGSCRRGAKGVSCQTPHLLKVAVNY